MHREMTLVRESTLQGNLADGQLVLAQESNGPLYAPANQILMNREAERPPKKYLTMRNTQTGSSGDLAERQIGGKILLDIFEHLF